MDKEPPGSDSAKERTVGSGPVTRRLRGWVAECANRASRLLDPGPASSGTGELTELRGDSGARLLRSEPETGPLAGRRGFEGTKEIVIARDDGFPAGLAQGAVQLERISGFSRETAFCRIR